LSWLGVTPDDLSALWDALIDPDAGVRETVHAVLGEHRPDALTAARLRQVARRALLDKDADLRLMAVETLSWLGVTIEEIDPLTTMVIDDYSSQVREAARMLLGTDKLNAADSARLRDAAQKLLQGDILPDLWDDPELWNPYAG
jgi:hypothetical protein